MQVAAVQVAAVAVKGLRNGAKMKSTNFGVLIAVLAVIFLTGDAVSAAESITTKDYWVLRDGYSEAFTRDATVTVSHESCGHCVDDVDGFFINYPGPSGQALKYDENGNLIYYWAEYGPDWVYVPDDPQQFLPNVMEIGKSYTCEWSRKEYANGMFQGFGSDSFSFTVSGPHTTTVGAGTFTTYILYIFDSWSTSYGESGTSTRIYYLAKGVGWVKMTINGETYELLSYSDGPPATPNLTLTTSETTVSVSWSTQVNAAGYALFYDRYPWDDTLTSNIDMGSQTSASFNLWEGATFRLAVQAYNSFGNSNQSNMAYLIIGYSLSVVPSSLSLSVGKTSSCKISGGTRPYSAASSNTAVATVSPLSGDTISVTGVSAGSATITISDGEANNVTVAVTVAPLLSVTPTDLSLSAGATGAGTISGGIRPYTAASSDTSVATVSVSDGALLITGVSAGSATITVGDSDSSSVTVSITVVPSLSVSETSLSLSIDATGTCDISGGATPYTAASSDKAVATVAVSEGTLSVKGVSAGSATITVSDSDSGSVTVSITVAPLLRVNPTRLSLIAGGTGSSCAVSGGVSPYSAASSKTTVARVSPLKGSLLTVTGVSAGSATITISDGDSGKVAVDITVAPSLSVSSSNLPVSVDATGTCTISGGVTPYNASSDDTSVANVFVSGNTLTVTGVSAGSATVSVRESGPESKEVSVTVVKP